MLDLKLVTYCGLYCGLCTEHNRIPQQAQALKEAMDKEGYPHWGQGMPGFPEFWKFLSRLCDPDRACPGCRQGGGPPFCTIRKCCREREIDLCLDCGEYPCRRVLGIAKGYPTLLADGQRLKEKGLEAWLEEQEARAKTGFNYADIRYEPYDIPED